MTKHWNVSFRWKILQSLQLFWMYNERHLVVKIAVTHFPTIFMIMIIKISIKIIITIIIIIITNIMIIISWGWISRKFLVSEMFKIVHRVRISLLGGITLYNFLFQAFSYIGGKNSWMMSLLIDFGGCLQQKWAMILPKWVYPVH